MLTSGVRRFAIMVARCLVLAAALIGISAPAGASVLPAPMRDAVDVYAEAYAVDQGWTYADRIDAHGDYRRAYFTLVFATDYPLYVDGEPAGRLPFTWKVRARVARCGPGWYRVSTPDTPDRCPAPRYKLPAW